MPVPDFLDTNVLVYSYDISNLHKQRIAQALVRKALSGEIVASTQVLAEFAATLLHKLTPHVSPQDVGVLLDALAPIKLVATDGDTVRRAVEAQAQHGVHFYEGMIVAAAERAGCKRIWSEDLNAGHRYFGIVVENPFK
jgi:predicted nucleic acid-binding protein